MIEYEIKAIACPTESSTGFKVVRTFHHLDELTNYIIRIFGNGGSLKDVIISRRIVRKTKMFNKKERRILDSLPVKYNTFKEK